MVRLELWKGASSDHDRVLGDFERLLPELPINAQAWNAAYNLARRARAAGMTIPATDLLIAACARHQGAELEHADTDFVSLEKL